MKCPATAPFTTVAHLPLPVSWDFPYEIFFDILNSSKWFLIFLAMPGYNDIDRYKLERKRERNRIAATKCRCWRFYKKSKFIITGFNISLFICWRFYKNSKFIITGSTKFWFILFFHHHHSICLIQDEEDGANRSTRSGGGWTQVSEHDAGSG